MKVLDPLSIYSLLLEENNTDYDFEQEFVTAENEYLSQQSKLSSEDFNKWKLDNPEIFMRARIWVLYVGELFRTQKTTESLKDWLKTRYTLVQDLENAIKQQKSLKTTPDTPDVNSNEGFEEMFEKAKESVSAQSKKLSPGEFKKWKEDNPETMWRARVWTLYQQDKTDMPLSNWINNNPEYKDNPYLKSAVVSSKPKKPKYLELPNPEPKKSSGTDIDNKKLITPDLEGKSASQISSLYKKYLNNANIYNKYNPPKSFAEWFEDYSKYKAKKSAISPVEQEYLDAYNLYIRLTTNPREKLTKQEFIEKYPEEYEKAVAQGRYNNYREKRQNSPTNSDLLSFDDWLTQFKDQQPDPNEKTPLEQEFIKKSKKAKEIAITQHIPITSKEFQELYPEEFRKWSIYKAYKGYKSRNSFSRKKDQTVRLKPFDEWFKTYQTKQEKIDALTPLEREYYESYILYIRQVASRSPKMSREEFIEKHPEDFKKYQAYATFDKKKSPEPFDEWIKGYQMRRAKTGALTPLEREYYESYKLYNRQIKSRSPIMSREEFKEEFIEKYPDDYKKYKAYATFGRSKSSKPFDEWLKGYQMRREKINTLTPLEREYYESFKFYNKEVRSNSPKMSREEFIEKYPEDYKKHQTYATFKKSESSEPFDEWLKGYQMRREKINTLTPLEREYYKSYKFYNREVGNKSSIMSKEEFIEKHPEDFKKYQAYATFGKSKPSKPFDEWIKGYQMRRAKIGALTPLEQEYKDSYNLSRRLTNPRKSEKITRKEFSEKYPEDHEKAIAYKAWYDKLTKQTSTSPPIDMSFDDWLKDYQAGISSYYSGNLSPLEREYYKAYSLHSKYKNQKIPTKKFKEEHPEIYKKSMAWFSFLNFRGKHPSVSFDEWLKDYQIKQAEKANITPLERKYRDSYNLYVKLVRDGKKLTDQKFLEKYPEDYKRYKVKKSYNYYKYSSDEPLPFDDWLKQYKPKESPKPKLNELNYLLYEYIKNISLNIL